MGPTKRSAHTLDTFILIVMERDAEWPIQVQGAAGCCVAALRQEPDESRSDLLRRAYERAQSIERVGAGIELAVLSCNDEPTVGALEGRARLACALLAAVQRKGAGRLELVVRAAAPERTRQSLVALAGGLMESPVGTSASVSARFLEARPAAPVAKSRRRLRPSVDNLPPTAAHDVASSLG